MSEPIRILQVFGIMNHGGAENMLMNLYRAIDKTKIQFDFVVHRTQKGVFDDEIVSMGGRLFQCPQFSMKNYFKYKKWWGNFFAKHKEYAVIHSHVRSSAAIYFKIARRFGIITIIHSHSTSNGNGFSALIKHLFQLRLREYSSYFFACSLKAGKWLFGKKIIGSDRFYVLKNAINLSNYYFDSTKRKATRNLFNIDESTLLFIHIGRFHESKNHEFLINVFKQIYLNNKNSKLILVGDGPLRKNIEKKVFKLGLDKNVIFAGLRSDIPELLMAADCFLFPSKWEGLPLTVIEAQASGLPCYVSNTITPEVKVSDNILSLSIRNGPFLWADAVLTGHFSRNNNCERISLAGYDVTKSVKWLSSFYTGIIKQK